jgi:hypothetical protein
LINPDIAQLVRRLSLAEHEITKARAEIGTLRDQCHRLTRIHAFAGSFGLLAVVVTLGGLWSVTTQASAVSPALTVRAPFIVVDDTNNPIMTVVDASTTKAKGKDGKEIERNHPRGVHVMNGWGEDVARLAASPDHNGYLLARQGGAGSTHGGSTMVLLADKDGTHAFLSGTDGKARASLTSDAGLNFFNESGEVRVTLNQAKLWLANATGKVIVEAGMLPDGRGVVRAGPRTGGPKEGGQLGYPYQLVGRK